MNLPHVEEIIERLGPRVLRSTVRPATAEDIKEASAKHAAGKCDHSVVIDSPGWLFDLRNCFTCGAPLGTV